MTLCNCRGAHDSAVAEWVIGAVLVMQRRLLEHLDAQRRSEWRDIVSSRGWLPPYAGDLEGASVLIVVFGSIGEAVEQRLLPFGVDVQRVARTARPGVSDHRSWRFVGEQVSDSTTGRRWRTWFAATKSSARSGARAAV